MARRKIAYVTVLGEILGEIAHVRFRITDSKCFSIFYSGIERLREIVDWNSIFRRGTKGLRRNSIHLHLHKLRGNFAGYSQFVSLVCVLEYLLTSKLSFLTRIFYFLRWDICRIFQRRVQPSPVCSFFFSFLSEYIDQIGNNNRKILPLSKRKRTVQAKIYINKHKYDASIENCEPFSEIERELPFKFHEKQVHGNGVPVSI